MGKFGKNRSSSSVSMSTSYAATPSGRRARSSAADSARNSATRSTRADRPRRRTKKPLVIVIILAALIALAVIFLPKLLSGQSLSILPGKVIYDDSLTATERELIESALDDYTPAADLTISAQSTFTRPADATSANSTNSESPVDSDSATSRNSADKNANSDTTTLAAQILLPVSDFYVSTLDVSSADLPAADSTYTTPAGSTVSYLDLADLSYTHRLLSLDGAYFFDDFNSGALFRLFTLAGTATDRAQAAEKIQSRLPAYPSASEVLSLSQTGVTALSRAMVTKLNQVGDATYFSAKIANFLHASDLTHISNEASFAAGCPGGSDTVSLCSDWRMLDTIQDIGTDIVELTGNHNNDYSTAANLETIAKYAELGLLTFGGGKDEASATAPLEISQKGTRLTLLGYNESTSTQANGQGASGSQPGANVYNPDTARADLAAAKARGDYVIVDIQYFECYSYPDEGAEMPACDAPISGQAEFFQSFIDLGADMVVGTQAHQPQTFELYDGKPIYYGLGNLFFDQTYWPGTTRGIILTHYFYKSQLLQTRITPTVYDTNLQVQPMDQETATWFINRLNAAR